MSKYIPWLRSSFYGSLNYSEWDGKFKEESQIVAQWVGKIDCEEVEKGVLRRLEKRLQVEGP